MAARAAQLDSCMCGPLMLLKLCPGSVDFLHLQAGDTADYINFIFLCYRTAW
jgi:hypothetical protein